MPASEEIRIYRQNWEITKKIKIRSGRKNIISVGDLGCLSIILFDNSGNTPIANTDYQIKGENGKEYSGTTDERGYLYHPDVPVDDYDLTVGESTVKVPVVLSKKEIHLQRVIDFEIP